MIRWRSDSSMGLAIQLHRILYSMRPVRVMRRTYLFDIRGEEVTGALDREGVALEYIEWRRVGGSIDSRR